MLDNLIVRLDDLISINYIIFLSVSVALCLYEIWDRICYSISFQETSTNELTINVKDKLKRKKTINSKIKIPPGGEYTVIINNYRSIALTVHLKLNDKNFHFKLNDENFTVNIIGPRTRCESLIRNDSEEYSEIKVTFLPDV